MARVEGEGALTIHLRDGRWTTCNCASSRRRGSSRHSCGAASIAEVPDITARICGICPVAYQMSACHALEALLGLTLPEPAAGSSADCSTAANGSRATCCTSSSCTLPISWASRVPSPWPRTRPEFADRLRDALQLKKAGNAIVDLVGGRAIHPINVRLGGFYRVPAQAELRRTGRAVERGSRKSPATWFAGRPSLDFPPFEHDYEFVALRHETEYPMNEGRLVSNRGLDIAMDEFPEQFEEYQVPYSNALQCRRKGGGAYFVGPLARWNLSADRADARSPAARPRDRDRLAVPQPLREHRRPRARNGATPSTKRSG